MLDGIAGGLETTPPVTVLLAPVLVTTPEPVEFVMVPVLVPTNAPTVLLAPVLVTAPEAVESEKNVHYARVGSRAWVSWPRAFMYCLA